MTSITTFINSSSRLKLRLAIYSWQEYLLLSLFIWYVLYTGLAGRVPFYDYLDELILVLMLGFALLQIIRRYLHVRFPSYLAILLSGIVSFVILSMLYFQASIFVTFQYLYLISRPFILLMFIYNLNIAVERVFNILVKISKFLIIYNLPAIIYNLLVINVKLIQHEFEDAIGGFFPFANNDSLIWLYLIILFREAFEVLIKGNRKHFWLFAGAYLLLLSTMNFKYVIMTTFLLTWLLLIKSRHKFRNILLFALVCIYPIMILFPIIQPRIFRIRTSPVYIAAEMIMRDKVEDHTMLLGTGPGNFTSPLAFDREMELTRKYGLLDIKRYWEEDYQGPTGTFTTSTSSALTLLGDAGLAALIIYMLFFIWGVMRNHRKLKQSYIFVIGFSAGILALVLGLFLNSWFWGLEILLMALSIKHFSDVETTSRNKLKGTIHSAN